MGRLVTTTIDDYKGCVVLVKEVTEVVRMGLQHDTSLFSLLQMLVSVAEPSMNAALTAEEIWRREGAKGDLVWRAGVFEGSKLPPACSVKKDKNYVVVILSPASPFCPHNNPINGYCTQCARLGEAAWWK